MNILVEGIRVKKNDTKRSSYIGKRIKMGPPSSCPWDCQHCYYHTPCSSVEEIMPMHDKKDK